jgi:hypothetical protein
MNPNTANTSRRVRALRGAGGLLGATRPETGRRRSSWRPVAKPSHRRVIGRGRQLRRASDRQSGCRAARRWRNGRSRTPRESSSPPHPQLPNWSPAIPARTKQRPGNTLLVPPAQTAMRSKYWERSPLSSAPGRLGQRWIQARKRATIRRRLSSVSRWAGGKCFWPTDRRRSFGDSATTSCLSRCLRCIAASAEISTLLASPIHFSVRRGPADPPPR